MVTEQTPNCPKHKLLLLNHNLTQIAKIKLNNEYTLFTLQCLMLEDMGRWETAKPFQPSARSLGTHYEKQRNQTLNK